jgi:hypothetical protein
LGVGLFTLTEGGGAGGWIVTDPVPCPVEPLLSVAVIVIMNLLAEVYVCVSDVAVPARTSGADVSPQLRVMDDIVPSASLATNVTVTSCPVLAGFGETFVTVATGGLSLIVSVATAELVEPLLSVAVTVIVKLLLAEVPVEAYVWVSLVAVPGRLSMAVPSPQFTVIPETVPSASVAVKVAVMIEPVLAGFGATPVMVTVGPRSLTVSCVDAEPVPTELVAETVIVKICDLELPVEE